MNLQTSVPSLSPDQAEDLALLTHSPETGWLGLHEVLGKKGRGKKIHVRLEIVRQGTRLLQDSGWNCPPDWFNINYHIVLSLLKNAIVVRD